MLPDAIRGIARGAIFKADGAPVDRETLVLAHRRATAQREHRNQHARAPPGSQNLCLHGRPTSRPVRRISYSAATAALCEPGHSHEPYCGPYCALWGTAT